MSALVPVLKQVFTNPVVIGTAVVVILYMNFCSYVANYRKKPVKSKKKVKTVSSRPSAVSNEQSDGQTSSDAQETQGDDGGADGENPA